MKQRLTAKEEEVMNIIWAKGEVFIRDIVAALPDPKPNYNTVATQVKFLEDKGFVKRKPMANSFQYSPALTERDYHGTTVGDVVSRYYNNSYISLVSQFVEEDKMDVEDLKNSFLKSKAKGNDRLHRNERVAAFRVLRILYVADAEDHLLHFQPILLDGWQPALLGSAARPLGFSGTAVSNVIPTLTLPQAVVSAEGGTLNAADKGISWLGVVSGIYFLGAFVVLIMNILSVIQTSRMIASGEHIQKEGFKVTIVDAPVASFSFLGHIVISREDFTATTVILTHEMSHVRKHHSVDVLLFSVVTVLHWFNPLVWLARAELKMLHEYEADESVINQGVNAADYQLLLVRKAVGEHRFRLANGFNHTKLSNRIAMMMSEKTNGWFRLAYVVCIPLLVCTLCFSSFTKPDSTGSLSDETMISETAPENVSVTVTGESRNDINIDVTTDDDEPVPFQWWRPNRCSKAVTRTISPNGSMSI